jgi:uncharacterized repeat protein (TIGR03803 family)
MLRKRFPFLLHQSLLGQRFLRRSSTILALAVLLMPTAWAKPKFKILHGVPGGLFTGLTFDAKGNLYGGTGGGGDHNDGTIFELTPGADGWTLTTLHSFSGEDGVTPNGGLIFDAAGNLYGTTPEGGAGFDGGVVFEMSPSLDGWSLHVLYNFCPVYHCPDGSNPHDGVILDRQGNIYGTATAGGSVDEGVAFELTDYSARRNENTLISFDSTSGIKPIAGLISDQVGNLYGTTIRGGEYGGGTVFELARVGESWKERVLYSFCAAGFPSCKDGFGPYAGVVFDASGNLYGTTGQGGGNQCSETTCGTIFKLARIKGGKWKHTVLYAFPTPEDGSFPTGGVVVDKAGNLYGATVAGGIGGCSGGCGVAYKLAPVADGKWKYTVLHKFDGSDGGQPLGGLIFDGKGNLYGTAYNVVFEITP